MTQRLGTFEEWYQWEMKQRDSRRKWHDPTKLTFRKIEIKDKQMGNTREIQQAIYETRNTVFKESGYVPLEREGGAMTHTETKYQRDARKANRRRAHRAEKQIREWVEGHTGTNGRLDEDTQMDALTDMLVDSQHFCRVADLDWAKALERAIGHFKAEVGEEEGRGEG